MKKERERERERFSLRVALLCRAGRRESLEGEKKNSLQPLLVANFWFGFWFFLVYFFNLFSDTPPPPRSKQQQPTTMASFDQDTMDPAQQLELAAAAAATGSRTLWQGDLPPFADEAYVASLYQAEGIVAVKFIRDRHTGFSQGYAFLEFGSHEAAADVLRRYSSQPIPGSQDCVFRLNWASHGVGRSVQEGESFWRRTMRDRRLLFFLQERERERAAASAPPFPRERKASFGSSPCLVPGDSRCASSQTWGSATEGVQGARDGVFFCWVVVVERKKQKARTSFFFPLLPLERKATSHQKAASQAPLFFRFSPSLPRRSVQSRRGESLLFVRARPGVDWMPGKRCRSGRRVARVFFLSFLLAMGRHRGREHAAACFSSSSSVFRSEKKTTTLPALALLACPFCSLEGLGSIASASWRDGSRG